MFVAVAIPIVVVGYTRPAGADDTIILVGIAIGFDRRADRRALGVAPRRRGLARAAALALLVALIICAPAAARSGWDSPFRFAQPFSLDVLPPHIAFAANGAAAVNFSVQNADNPSQSHGVRGLALGLGHALDAGASSRHAAGADLGLHGSTLELLTGDSPAGNACCSSVAIRTMSA